MKSESIPMTSIYHQEYLFYYLKFILKKKNKNLLIHVEEVMLCLTFGFVTKRLEILALFFFKTILFFFK